MKVISFIICVLTHGIQIPEVVDCLQYNGLIGQRWMFISMKLTIRTQYTYGRLKSKGKYYSKVVAIEFSTISNKISSNLFGCSTSCRKQKMLYVYPIVKLKTIEEGIEDYMA